MKFNSAKIKRNVVYAVAERTFRVIIFNKDTSVATDRYVHLMQCTLVREAAEYL